MSWDLLLAASYAVLMVPILVALANPHTYIPRWSTGPLIVGLIGATIALFGLGAVFGATVTGLEVVLWGLVFWMRGKKNENLP